MLASRQNHRAKFKADPSYRAHVRAQAREHYERNKESILTSRRARLDALSPDELLRWMERMRGYQRAYQRRWWEDLKKSPERHAAYLDRMAEYHRRRALTELVTLGAKLEDKL